MNIDERLERLVERHEALAQTVELIAIGQQKTSEQIHAITAAMSMDAENIRALARIAEIHERRISHLEGTE
jgi:ribosomal protein L12E/L44/L45/RPP1/RPP2